jgi:hypothetical protein
MKRRYLPLLAWLCLSLNATAQSPPTEPEEPDPGHVVALSMGKQITHGDLNPDDHLVKLNRSALDPQAYQDWVERARVAKLTELIFVPLLGEFGRENGISASEAEIDEFLEKAEAAKREAEAQFTRQKASIVAELERTSLAPSERQHLEAQLETLNSILESKADMERRARERFGEDYSTRMRTMDEANARQIIVAWKLNKKVFDDYGGRVVLQDDGPEPLEAYAEFLAKKKKEGTFGIYDAELQAAFWDYFQSENLHSFYTPEESHDIMKQPWWERRRPVDEE